MVCVTCLASYLLTLFLFLKNQEKEILKSAEISYEAIFGVKMSSLQSYLLAHTAARGIWVYVQRSVLKNDVEADDM